MSHPKTKFALVDRYSDFINLLYRARPIFSSLPETSAIKSPEAIFKFTSPSFTITPFSETDYDFTITQIHDTGIKPITPRGFTNPSPNHPLLITSATRSLFGDRTQGDLCGRGCN